MTKSSVWPRACVGSVTCCTNPNVAQVEVDIEVSADNYWTAVGRELLKHRWQVVEKLRRHRGTSLSVDAEQHELTVRRRRVAIQVLDVDGLSSRIFFWNRMMSRWIKARPPWFWKSTVLVAASGGIGRAASIHRYHGGKPLQSSTLDLYARFQ